MLQVRRLIFGHTNRLVRAESGRAAGNLRDPHFEWPASGPYGRLAQLEERFPYKEEVGGSSPSTPTENACRHLGFPSVKLRVAGFRR